MNRRNFFKTSSKVAIGAAVASQMKLQTAFAAEGEQILIESEIERNHGHSFSLDAADVIRLLRKNHEEGTESKEEVVSIQGVSGHPHDVVLNESHLMSLLLGEELSLESTSVAGHTHTVLIKMTIELPQ